MRALSATGYWKKKIAVETAGMALSLEERTGSSGQP
jgi:hypothetical protein